MSEVNGEWSMVNTRWSSETLASESPIELQDVQVSDPSTSFPIKSGRLNCSMLNRNLNGASQRKLHSSTTADFINIYRLLRPPRRTRDDEHSM